MAPRDPYTFGVQILANGIDTRLASHARSLHASKRSREARGAIVVHPHRSGLELRRHRHRALQIARPDRSRQTERHVIADAHGVSLVIEGDDTKDWSEHFFLRDAHPHVYVGKDGRFDELASTQVRARLAAGHTAGAFGLCD